METRTTRYSRKNRFKRKMKNIIKELPKKTLKNVGYLIVGIFYIFYIALYKLNDFIAICFMKLPRLMRVALIYILIINVGLDLYGIFNCNNQQKELAIAINSIETQNIPQNQVIEEENNEVCNLDSTSCKIYTMAKEIGLSEEQTLMSIAISRWETGNYTSDAFINKNNVGGMMCSSGLIIYNTLDEGINAFLTNLKNNYFDIGLDTLEKIQPKYCPIGAENDPNNLNQYWLNGVTNIYLQLIGK